MAEPIRHRILIVDDEESVCRSMRRLLSNRYEVKTAGGAADALELLRSEAFDIVLSDVSMPGMLGTDFLAEVGRQWPGVQRILMSGGHDHIAIPGVEAGVAIGFIPKPWRPEELERVLFKARVNLTQSSQAP